MVCSHEKGENAYSSSEVRGGVRMSQEEIARFADRELEQIAAQREQAIKAPFADLHWDTYRYTRFLASYGIEEGMEAITAKGGLPYLGALPVGESRLILQAKIPKIGRASCRESVEQD